VLTFILMIPLVVFLEILYHIPAMICNVMEACEGDILSTIPVYEFELYNKDRRDVSV
jgi:hypothetical protein